MRLKKFREQSKLSQKELADLAGVSPSTYRDWEYGKQILGEPYLALARALDVSVYELLTGEKTEVSELMKDIERLEYDVKKLKKTAATILSER